LSKEVSGELDWIVMKALEKDRNRRYETASAFAADIERHLRDEPVQAGPPSAAYRFRKFARRNKSTLTIATAMALAVLVAVGSIGWVLRDRSARQNELNYRVELALEDAHLARDRALTQTDNRFQWEVTLAAALSTLRRGEELAAGNAAALDPAIAERLHELRAALDADERDYRFVIRLDEILQGVIVWDAHRSRSKSEQSFLKMKEALKSYYAWDVGVTPTAEVATFIEQCPQPVQEHLLTALDVCLACVPQDDPQVRSWLGEVLQAADSDAWRKQARDALTAGDWHVLEKLLQEVSVSQQRPALLYLLASWMPDEAHATKRELLPRIRDAYPDEFWAHSRFAIALSHDVLAWYLADLADPGSRDETWAVELAREAVRLVPNDADFRNTLGVTHYRAGNWQEAVAALEKAMELSNGGRADDWFILAMAHWRLGDKDAARRWFDQAVEWTQTHEPPWYNDALRRYEAEARELINQQPAGGNEKSESKIIHQ
jgi:tetratricopeptide (TPR) repeat protein